jgi:hypothetical protein
MATDNSTVANTKSRIIPEMGTKLDTLPTEIVQQICGELPAGSLNNVRLACKNLYVKTLYVYKQYIEHIDIDLESRNLCRLLDLTSTPFLFNEIKSITLRPRPCQRYRNGYSIWLKPDIAALMKDELHQQDENSPDVYYILQAVCQCLLSAKSLHYIHAYVLPEAALAAIDASNLDNSIFFEATFDPRKVTESYPEAPFSGIVKGFYRVNIVAKPEGYCYLSGFTVLKDHFRGSNWSSSGLSRLLRATKRFTFELSLTGCPFEEASMDPFIDYGLLRKSRDGYINLWNNTIRLACRSLRVFELREIYIDSYSLRTFFKRHISKLVTVELSEVRLTRGTWKAIFKVLRSGQLDTLRLHCLYQKRFDGTVDNRPADPLRYLGIEVHGESVKSYLDFLYQDSLMYREPHTCGEIRLGPIGVPGIERWDPNQV